MTAVVFLGPTLPAAAATARLACTVLPSAACIMLPPAAQGDVYRAVRDLRPTAIGLVDGVFLSARPVWHREILWALDQGIAVFGAASMGALRAAELLPFGMRGIGRVFEAFRDATWPGEDAPFEDDDEVAVVHAPAELGGGALSDAMVDLRATLDAAVAAGVIDRDAQRRLTGAMKALHFPERSFVCLAASAEQLLPPASARAFTDFLAEGSVRQKRLDAGALLDAMAAFLAGPPAPRPDFVFERTQIWERFRADAEGADAPGAAEIAVLDELRLDPTAWLAASPATELLPAADATPALLHDRLDRFRRARALWHRADLDAWMAANAVDEAGLARLLRREVDGAVPLSATALAALLDQLRLTGRFGPLLARARCKQAALAARPFARAGAAAIDHALDWYRGERAGGLDRAALWPDPAAYHQAVWAEYVFDSAGSS